MNEIVPLVGAALVGLGLGYSLGYWRGWCQGWRDMASDALSSIQERKR